MRVTVVGRWHVPVGRADQVIASARHQLMTRAGTPRARQSAQIFQAVDEIGALLYVSEWSDRVAFESYRAQAEGGTVEAAIRDAGEYLICERQLFFGNYAYRAVITGCGIIEVPPEMGTALRQLLMPNGRWALHGSPGLVHYAVYREVTHSHRYVVVHGWQSEAALLAMRERREITQEVLDTYGGSVVQFSGYECASTDLA
jgi:hypothetical protein